MAKFQYTYNSSDIDVAHLTIDDTFDITLIRRETGIAIDILDGGDTCLGSLFIDNPQEV